MTATEELRRLLDERGVEWHDTKIGKGFITVFEHDGITWIATEHSSGRLSVKGCVKPTQGHYDGMTPEQAVKATLGTGECRDANEEDNDFTCSECGASMFTMIEGCWTMIGRSGLFKDVIKHPSYCPNCGRRVVDDCR